MPHINVKCFPSIDEERTKELVLELTHVITKIFKCNEDMVSIAFETIAKEFWNEKVYIPEIVNRKDFLVKCPNY